jgi:hypothetical protein
MRSHRFALTTLVLLGTVLAAGCGSGRNTEAFLPAAEPATASAPVAASAIPQVVVAGPKQALIDERDAAAAEAKASRQAAAEADRKRQVARRELRKERAKAKRDRRRAAHREAELQSALVAAEKSKPKPASVPAPATPKPAREPASAPITASDTGSQLVTERNRRSDAEARAAVLRFHQLLDGRDARSCDMLTAKLLAAVYGAEDTLGRCRAAVAQIASTVSVVIAESRTSGKASSVAVVTTIGDQQFPQTMHLVLVDGSWLFDAVERRPAA